jgi:hypothetical protein
MGFSFPKVKVLVVIIVYCRCPISNGSLGENKACFGKQKLVYSQFTITLPIVNVFHIIGHIVANIVVESSLHSTFLMSMDVTCIKLEFAILRFQNTLHVNINLSM